MGDSKQKTGARALLKYLIIIPSFIAVQIVILIVGLVLGTYLHFARGLPTVSELKLYQPRVPCYESEECEHKRPEYPVDMDQIPTHVVHAFVAAEDHDFLNRDSRLSEVVYLKHTLTSWIARSLVLDDHHSHLAFQIKWLILTTRMEYAWDKEKILRVYLNQIYLGNGCYGIGKAARHYFGKPIENVSLSQAALLAGIPKSPGRYNPLTNPDQAEKRRIQVLDAMQKAGFLSPARFREAVAEPVAVVHELIPRSCN